MYGYVKSLIATLFGIAIGSAAFSSNSYANPTDGQVVAGQAAISQPDANTVQIDQSSAKAVIDWRSFNINPQETTRFNQPSSSSITLNRIDPGQGASSILGHLTANGQVWLLNPAGIFFGPGARIDVAGLIATTGWMNIPDFINGNYKFLQVPGWNGGVVNAGTITVSDAGLVALVAPGVENSGVIQANFGTVVLAAGKEFTLDFYGDQLINFGVNSLVTSPAKNPHTNEDMRDGVRNSGIISANGGKVLLTAAVAQNVLDSAINTDGMIEAKAAVRRGGDIVLLGGDEGLVKVSGSIDASGKLAKQSGGKVKILGKQIIVAKKTNIDVSGDVGGGEVLIGGNAHGYGPEVNAKYVYFSPDANIFADALTEGNGGKVVLWSDVATYFYGNIYARGGSLAGNGGWVEVSGKENLGFNGFVDTTAAYGNIGSLLLDPTNIEVITGGSATLAQVDQFADADLTTCANMGGAACSKIDPGTINAAGSNVTLQANNNILFTNAVSITTAGIGLTATATNSITVNAGITTANRATTGTTGAIALTATNGSISLNSNLTTGNATVADASGNQTPASGGITLSAGTSITGTGALITGTSSITGASQAGTDTATSGGISLTAGTAGVSGGIGLSNANALQIGTASRTTTVTDSATTGNITLSSRDEINNGTASTPLALTIGLASGATTNTQGILAATTTQAAGNVFVTSSGALRLGAFTTAGGAISTTGVGLTQAASTTINAGAGNIILNAGANTLTMGSGSLMLTSGNISITANNMVLNTSGTPSQIGGTGNNSGLSSLITVVPTTAATTIGLSGGAGTLNLTNAELNTARWRSTNITIGNTSSGLMTVNAWTPAAAFASGGTLTLQAGSSGLTVAGALSLATNLSALTALTSGPLTLNANVTTTNKAISLTSSQANIGSGAGYIQATNVDVGAGTGAITVAADEIQIGTNTGSNAFTSSNSTAALTLKPFSAGTAMSLAATSPATTAWDISNAEVSAFLTGISGPVVIGDAAASTGVLTVGANAISFTGGNVFLNAGSFTDGGANAITATTLNLNARNSGGSIGSSGNPIDMTVTNATFNTNTAGNGSVFLNATGGVALGSSAVGTGSISLAAAGAVTQSAAITQTASAGAVTVSAGAAAITLTNASNNFTGAVSLNNSGANNVAITNNGALNLGISSIGTGTLGLTGVGITQTGSITQAASAGAVTVNAGAGVITLTNASNSFTGGISLNNSGANNVAITNSGALSLGTLSVGTGTLGLTGVGITQTGSITQAASAGAVAVNAGAGVITLTNASNNFTGAIGLNNSGAFNVGLVNNGTLSLGTSSIGTGTLDLTGVGITQTGSITQAASAGAVTVNAGAGAITLTNASNSFTGAVGLNNSGAFNVGLTNSGVLNIGTSSVGNNLNVTASGVITQSGALTVPGTSTFNAGTGINLNNVSNLLNVVNLANSTSGNINLNNNANMTLTASNAASGGNIDVVTGAGSLSVVGAVTTVGGGSITLTTGGTSNNLSLGANVSGGAVNLISTGSISQSAGALTATALSISNTSSTTNLTRATNSIGNLGNISATGQTVNLVNSIDLSQVNSTSLIASNLSINTSGAISLGQGTGQNNAIGIIAANLSGSGKSFVFTNNPTSTGTLTLGSVNSINGISTTGNGSISITNSNGGITVSQPINSGAGAITLASTGSNILNSTITGGPITLSGQVFINNVGATALNPTGGNRFLVYSVNPANDTRGIVYDFKQYNISYPSAPAQGAGNGFLYSVALTITPILSGAVSRVYDGSTTAPVTNANYGTSTGAIDGDTVAFTQGSAVYNNKNVGTGKNVSASSISIVGASNGAATVYGYQLASTSANANIGTISAAPITISSNAGQTKVYGSNDSGSAATAYGVASGTLYDSLTGSMGRVAGETVGSYNFTQNTVSINDGNSGNNYAITFNGATNPFTVTARSLTGSIANQTKVYGANDPTLSGISVSLGNVVNTTVTDINGNNTVINDTGNVATTLATLTRAAGELVSGSPYNITAATFNTLSGSAAGNYSAPSFTGTPTLAITQKSLTGSIGNQTKVYGADDPSLSGIGVTLGGVVNGSVTNWMGTVTNINDTANVSSTVNSLVRATGEVISGSPYAITSGSFNLAGSASGNYSAPTFTGTPTLAVTPASLTGSIANQTKVYGADDPTLSGIGVTLGGVINRSVATWNGSVSVNNTGNVTTTLASLTRTAGEVVSGSPYNITAATFNTLAGSAAGNYSAPTFTGTPTLAVTPASLSGSIANQTKVYGADDPTLSGIGVTLGGVINRSIATWNGSVSVDNTGNVTTALASLTRVAGEVVSGSPYNITAATFNSLSGSAAGNYSAPTFTGTPTLAVTPASLTGSIANQTKVYGADDPSLGGIGVTLSGIINRTVSTWNGGVVVNNTGNVTTTLASLTRAAGEVVSGSPYSITAATFNSLSGSAAGNYSAPTFTGTPTLAVTPASLTGSIANQTKVYGADDPTLSGVGVTLGGVINRSIATWNGSVSVDNTGNVTTTLASLTRVAGEVVSGSPYNITAATFNTLAGSAAGNYSAPAFTGTPTLAVTPASLTGSIANQTKVYGSDDPSLGGIGVTLSGIINRTVSTWNGGVVVNNTGNVTTTLASLTRAAGEVVSGSPYSITAATFNTLGGSAAGNYSAPTFTGAPTLSVTPASLTGSIANQTKVYGADDPTLSGIGVTLNGIINRTVTTWNGDVIVNNTGNVTTTLASLTRAAGEVVSGSPYNITAATFNTLSGSAAGNYSAPSFTGTPTLAITQKSLTGSIGNQTKVYGADDPSLSGIGVTLGGVVNGSVTNWMGTVTNINDTANVSSTVNSLVRATGEVISGSPYAITSGSFNLAGSASGNYSAPTFTGAPTLAITPASLTGSVANQTKIYGADDPTLSGIGVTLGGVINRSVATWNGSVSVNNTGNVTTTLASLTRTAGEVVSGSPYNITAATFNTLAGSAAGNYSAPTFTGTPTLAVTPASLSGSIANQTKVYGADDPTLSGIGVTLGGVINRSIATWNGSVSVDNTGNVTTALASLTRVAGEVVSGSPYNITAATFNSLSGSAAGNYSAPTFTGTPTLAVTPASLTGSIANQTKVYGADDPSLGGIGVTLSGIINRTVSTWNGGVVVNNTGNVTTTLASLTRAAGEVVSGSPYSITAATFNSLSGSAAGNYSAPTFTGTPTLAVTPASLTGSIANQTKVYGADDPTLSGVGVTLGGVINRSIATWNGSVSVDNTGNVTTTLASLTRVAGEVVSGSPYNITAATFNTLAGSAAGNYSAPAFTGTPTLAVTPASLTGSIANQTKVYGSDDPSLGGIGVTLSGIINRTVSTWNGGVVVNNTGNVTTTLASLTRAAGEVVSGSPYSITAATFNTLGGSAAGNYSSPTFTVTPTLAVTPASLTGSIANQTKVYGADDPTLSGIGVTLSGIINRTVSTWNGGVVVNNTGNVTTTLASLTRVAGEVVSGSPYSITAATFNSLSGSAAGNYSAPTFTGTPTLAVTPASLTGSIVNQTKVYGADDPTLSGIGVTLSGIINRTVSTWNGGVVVNNTGNVTTTLASLTRVAGEVVSGSPYNITAATFNTLGGSAAGNYSAPTFTGTPTLAVTPASLTGSIANQTKVYGADDPTLSGIGVTLSGIINRTVSTWNGDVVVNNTGNVTTTLASLTRVAGEVVSGSPYNITAATFNTLSGSAAGNYSAPTFTGTPTLAVTPASLTGSIANQTKVYGADDPTLSGISVTLGGVINRSIATWNGSVSVNNTGNVTTTLASLTRTAGEVVSGSPYNITAATFNTLGGSAAGNYSAPTFTGTPTLAITPASLTGSIANQAKVYGADDPTLSGIGVTLGGVINRSIATWNGSVSVDDTGNVTTTLASLTRVAGEVVSGSPYSITAATFNTLGGSAAGNYSAPTFTGTPTLSVTPASLTGSIANQTKVYGADDPTLSGIGVTLNGIINRTVTTWNGDVIVNNTGNVTTTLASLTRAAGEVVSGSPYNITAATFNTLGGSAAGNYSAPTFTGTPTLAVTPASLTGSIANQTKVYGADDPTLSGIGVTLGGVVNRSIATWNGSVSVNNTGNVTTTLASLTRTAGEVVSGSPYNITAATFNTLGGSAAGNYTAPTFTGTPTLAVTPASLTGSIANQTKVYGADDTTLSGIGVTLGGVINRSIATWNGSVSVDDTGNVTTTLVSLSRVAGEVVSGSPYNITAATFNTLSGSAAGNYSAPTFTGTPTLAVTPASLTGSIANQTKVYGVDDPTLSGIGVTLNGVINRTVSTWNGSVIVNNTGNVTTTLASLTRAAGEVVSGSPYNITAATFNTLSGSAAGNYSAPTFTGTPTLAITPASLTGSIANQTKVYGADDPSLGSIGVNLGGVINRSIATWNGSVSVDDTGNVATSLATLVRNAGELASGSPYNITTATFNALSGSAAGNYSAPTFTGTPTLAITPASLSGSIANQTKVYGADDPTLSGIGVTLGGVINRSIATWNGSVSVNNTGNVTTTLASLTRTAGEVVSGSPYNITAATFNTLAGSAAGNYSAPTFTGTPTLAITPASLTGSIANQTKVYGADDPTLSGIGVTLSGIINRTVSTWNGSVVVNNTGNVTTTLASLARVAGEVVSGSPYNITAATFNTLAGSAAGNYSAPTFTGTPTLAITPASLTGSIANQTKVYGADDPTLSGISVTLGGVINRSIATWNGSVSVDNTGNVTTTLASLTRVAGEVVSGSPYNITAATFNTLAGSAAGNYSAPTFTGTPTLAITPASLTGSIANQTKVYGADDPTLSGISVTLGGVINRSIATWNGSVSVDNTGNVTTTLASLTRTAGEVVGGSPYNITAATFNTLAGSAAGNYSAPTFTGTPTLAVTPASLTGSIANQTKVYGADDPTLSGIGVTLGGVINRSVATWNGSVSVDDTGNVATSLASLVRNAGELVSGSPYSITAATFNSLSGSAAGNYSAPTFTGAPTLAITPASLTGSIANQTKVYGADDPTLSGIGVTLSGIINRTVSTWNGGVVVNNTGNVTTTLASLTRAAGEVVSGSPYNITAATFSTLGGSAAGNYSAPTFTGTPTLAVTPASLSGSIANQTKVYGADDPTLSGIGVTLGGVINRSIATWNGSVSVNNTGNVTTTLASLTRTAGEVVSGSPYNITAATFNTLAGSAAGNYTAPTFTGTPTLAITPASLTGSIASQTKVYGADDPTLSGIGVTLGGVINRSIATWNGSVSVDDTGNVATSLASLVRNAGELVSGSPYSITAATFNALSGSAAGNYSAPTFSGTPTLAVIPASLTGSIANQTKVYGADDPTLSGIGVTLSGIINRTVTTWNGGVVVNNTGNVTTTLASLTRAAGEVVSGSPYNITAATFNTLSGSAAGNYSAPTFTGTPTLVITPASLTGSIANQTKVYGADDPSLSGIGVTLGGVINRSIATWNGSVSVNNTGDVTTTLASLTRTAGEVVGGSPYNITAATFNTLAGSAAGNYSAPTFTGTPTLAITPASLTGSIANQTKVYGADDPTLSGIGVTLSGIINRTVSTWNGGVVVNNTGNVTTTLASLTRVAGEVVSGSPYNITAATFNTLSGSAAGNYSAPTFTGTPTLAITPAGLTGSIANQTKVYGADDPALSGIGVTLGGVINQSIATWNGSVSVNDTGNVATSLATLVRNAGELVSGSSYSITAATFNSLSGTAAGNYSAPTFTGTPTLAVTPASLTGSIANQTKVYGADDPSLSGIGVTLGGVINQSIATWNGSVSVNDTGNVATSLATLVRNAGELVSGSPYSITAAIFNSLSGTAAGNYSAPIFTGTPTLAVTPASLIGSIANQTKVYGADDPSLGSIGVTLSGIINRTVSTWNGGVVVNNTGNVTTTLASLTRVAGEVVSGSPYNITAATFNSLSGTAAGNYSAPTFTGTPTLAVTPASLTGSIANQTKVYGADDPSLSGIGVALNGIINRTVSTWNGSVSVNDTANVSSTLTALVRATGEVISGSPYAITSGSFNLAGSASGNYSAPTFSGTPTLAITPASLTGSIANQTKVYGADDPSLGGIGVTLGGVINRSVATWNGGVSVNDTGNVATSLASLARNAGELVSGSPYAITAGTFNALAGSAASNYNVPSFAGTPTLTINKADLTASISNQTKVYGSNDPALAGISVTVSGVINNPAIVTWNGNVSVNDIGNVSTTLTSLNRVAGETVANSPYSYTSATFTSPTGSASANYNVPNSFVGNPILTITPATLTITGVTAENKIFDATTSAILQTASAQLVGVLSMDIGSVNVSGNGTGFFANADVGNNISVTASSIPISGFAAGNYQLQMPIGLFANILSVPAPAPTPTPTPVAPQQAQNIAVQVTLPITNNTMLNATFGAGSNPSPSFSSSNLSSGSDFSQSSSSNSSDNASNNNQQEATSSSATFTSTGSNSNQQGSATGRTMGQQCATIQEGIEICTGR